MADESPTTPSERRRLDSERRISQLSARIEVFEERVNERHRLYGRLLVYGLPGITAIASAALAWTFAISNTVTAQEKDIAANKAALEARAAAVASVPVIANNQKHLIEEVSEIKGDVRATNATVNKIAVRLGVEPEESD